MGPDVGRDGFVELVAGYPRAIARTAMSDAISGLISPE
jgi:hypothetical protein